MLNIIRPITNVDDMDHAERYFQLSFDRTPSLDPAENIRFDQLNAEECIRFDFRNADELRHAGEMEASAVERERAIWEFADRAGRDALPFILERVTHEPDSLVRRGLLWLIQKKAQKDDVRALLPFTN